ncbi:NAD(P)-binding protein [Lojkania enalia]|uniref:NAD(P)-binding protein n=1 Tax=Lojkania enalia TaxID=147567 RepID=A0A9P4K4X3_9PLEO|nr:NAD(P)-binding protein [Didymosphaeria enalia]
MALLPQPTSVLVVGGCGFVGYHIVRYLLQDATFASVAVLSRSAPQNTGYQVHGAKYFSGDITDLNSLRQALQAIKPTVIIHASAPPPTTGSAKDYKRVIVGGTRNLLQLALESKEVQAFVYTSSNMVTRGREHLDTKEDHPLANTDPKAPAYARAKADAEEMVLKANTLPEFSIKNYDWSGFLATGALRFPIVYGTHNSTAVSGCMAAVRNKETNVLIGDGDNIWSYCSTQNVAESHALLAHALLGPDFSTIAGEAYNINDGEPRLFWGFVREVWRIVGHEDKKDLSTKIPAWLALALADILEFFFWVFTLGRKRPGLLGRQQVEYCCFTHTYNIDKARERLGFMPKQNYEEILRESVRWLQEEHMGIHGLAKS